MQEISEKGAGDDNRAVCVMSDVCVGLGVNMKLSGAMFFLRGSLFLDDVPTLIACILMSGIKVQENRGDAISTMKGKRVFINSSGG